MAENDGVVGTIPAVTQAEFGARPLSQSDEAELKALEAQIEAQMQGKAAPPPPAPVAPVVPMPAPTAEVPPPPVVPPMQPPPAPVAEVPAKFLNQDGSVNVDNLEKSRLHLDAAIQKASQDYREKERELSRIREQQRLLETGQMPPQVPQGYPPGYPAQPPMAPVPFEQRVAQDYQANPAGTTLGLMQTAIDIAVQRAREEVADIKRDMELRQIAAEDPGALTPEGLAKLAQVRRDNPWIEASPQPWVAAYRQYRGQHGSLTPARQESAITPPTRPTAPILAGGQQPPSPAPSAPASFSPSDLKRYVEQKFPGDPLKQSDYIAELINRSQRRG